MKRPNKWEKISKFNEWNTFSFFNTRNRLHSHHKKSFDYPDIFILHFLCSAKRSIYPVSYQSFDIYLHLQSTECYNINFCCQNFYLQHYNLWVCVYVLMWKWWNLRYAGRKHFAPLNNNNKKFNNKISRTVNFHAICIFWSSSNPWSNMHVLSLSHSLWRVGVRE